MSQFILQIFMIEAERPEAFFAQDNSKFRNEWLAIKGKNFVAWKKSS